jgi:hypothetical protein
MIEAAKMPAMRVNGVIPAFKLNLFVRVPWIG